MDPRANIVEQVEIARALLETAEGEEIAPGIIDISDEDRRANEDRGERLAELVLALDEWRRKGGFDPYTNVSGDARVLDAIAAALSGESWSPDTLDQIAEIVTATGRTIDEPDES